MYYHYWKFACPLFGRSFIGYVCIFDKFFPHTLSVECPSLLIVPSVFFSPCPASESR